MTPEYRKNMVVHHEGQVLTMMAHNSDGGDGARAIADGVMNAIMRVEGREAAAKFAFALADRVVGGIKITDCPPIPGVEVPPKPDLEAVIRSKQEELRPERPWWHPRELPRTVVGFVAFAVEDPEAKPLRWYLAGLLVGLTVGVFL